MKDNSNYFINDKNKITFKMKKIKLIGQKSYIKLNKKLIIKFYLVILIL